MHDGHRERLRKRFLETGFNGFSSHEILEMFLFNQIPRQDTNPLAHKLINIFGSLSAVFDAHPLALIKEGGLSEGTAIYISMIPQLLEKYKEDKQKEKLLLNNNTRVVEYLQARLADLREEEFHLLCLDGSLRLISDITISRGTESHTILDLKKMNKYVTLHNASNIILAHNHPNGECIPSRHDDIATKKVVEAFSNFGINVIDHFIITGTVPFSYHREGLLVGFAKVKNKEVYFAQPKKEGVFNYDK